MGKLDGKVAIVTGAGRGHAEAIAKLFAKEGAAIAMCDIIPLEKLEKAVGSTIRSEGGKALCFHTDVSEEHQVNQMVEQTIEEFGSVDILVNTVGIAGPTKDAWDITIEEWKKTLAVNLDSVFICTKAVLPEMIRRKWGRIINFSSGTGKQPLAHRTPYATTKMGVIGYTRTLAVDVGKFNITANTICPGFSGERNVEIARSLANYRGVAFNDNEYRQLLAEMEETGVLAGRWLAREGYTHIGSTPKDVALLALFLASDHADRITGQDINVTGGSVMW
jgi:NAD(P)-dependent dehydrogenase (short-subunit alcohol dehydrogenase family)